MVHRNSWKVTIYGWLSNNSTEMVASFRQILKQFRNQKGVSYTALLSPLRNHWPLTLRLAFICQVIYPLVNVYITMENHHVQWVNPRTKWSCSIAMSQVTRGYIVQLFILLVMNRMIMNRMISLLIFLQIIMLHGEIQLPSGKWSVCYWKLPFTVDLPIKNGDFP